MRKPEFDQPSRLFDSTTANGGQLAKEPAPEIPDEPRDPEILPDLPAEPQPDLSPEIPDIPAPEFAPWHDDPEISPSPDLAF